LTGTSTNEWFRSALLPGLSRLKSYEAVSGDYAPHFFTAPLSFFAIHHQNHCAQGALQTIGRQSGLQFAVRLHNGRACLWRQVALGPQRHQTVRTAAISHLVRQAVPVNQWLAGLASCQTEFRLGGLGLCIERKCGAQSTAQSYNLNPPGSERGEKEIMETSKTRSLARYPQPNHCFSKTLHGSRISY